MSAATKHPPTHLRVTSSIFAAFLACTSAPPPELGPFVVPGSGPCSETRPCEIGNCVRNQCVCDNAICDGVCTNTRSDPQNCGACGRVCQVGSQCEQGACACRPDTCGPSCVYPYDDDNHCGACGRRCSARTHCAGRECVCADGWGSCGGATECSTPLLDNPMHCGACDARCFDDERCVGGVCVRTSCERGRTACSPSDAPCGVDLETSNQHCGACGHTCAEGSRCVGGRCVSTSITQRMPGSMLQVSSARPWFRWTLRDGVDGAHLEVCSDPACARREFEFDVTGERYRPTASLSAGIHFWRVFARRGASTDATPSPVWAFEVLDTMRPLSRPEPIVDLNGDGVRDTVTGGIVPFREYGVIVRYGVSPDVTLRADDALRGPMSTRQNPLEIVALTAIGAGDLDGDGLSDVILSMQYRVRQSEIQSYPVLRLTPLYGSRVGAPRLGAPSMFSAEGYPGPYVSSRIALGNALGIAGFIAGVGNSPICRATDSFVSPSGAGPRYLTCYDGTLTAGDYNADARVEMIDSWPPYATREARAVPLCGPVLWLDTLGGRHDTFTRDVDLDGYDDLVLWLDETTNYTVYGGPGGLDGSRCSASP